MIRKGRELGVWMINQTFYLITLDNNLYESLV